MLPLPIRSVETGVTPALREPVGCQTLLHQGAVLVAQEDELVVDYPQLLKKLFKYSVFVHP